MEEYIGKCSSCGKAVYCENGFLNGVHENGRLFCFTCAEEKEGSESDQSETR